MLAFNALENIRLKPGNGSGFVVIAALHTDGRARRRPLQALRREEDIGMITALRGNHKIFALTPRQGRGLLCRFCRFLTPMQSESRGRKTRAVTSGFGLQLKPTAGRSDLGIRFWVCLPPWLGLAPLALSKSRIFSL